MFYDKILLINIEECLKWLIVSCVDFENSNDLFIKFVVVLFDIEMVIEDKSKMLSGKVVVFCFKYMSVIIEW